jgi:hypothetical protein
VKRIARDGQAASKNHKKTLCRVRMATPSYFFTSTEMMPISFWKNEATNTDFETKVQREPSPGTSNTTES